MVRKRIAVLLGVAVLCLRAAAATPEASLELGLRAFRAGDYASARIDLGAATAAVSLADLQTYVEAGQLDRLQSFETALVYLALSQFRLGSEDDARQTIQRLLEAERLAPVYANLPLQADAAEFETLVTALVPDATLPTNGETTVNDSALPLPPVKPAVQQVVIPQPAVEPEPSGVSVPAMTPERPTPTPAPPLPARPAAVAGDSILVRQALNSLRQAEALADQGEVREAEGIYVRLAAAEPREIVAAAAVGLYRTGAYREAVQAFRRLGALGRGEEDLHYYFAVSLYESGEYEAARRELMCALPYIELTDEVARYRIKIEQALAHMSASQT
ncbi:MAG TPA: tetratricopeptide repeat protein [Thermoanaerobaculia bacterium]|nr:tetratricopeptide repeat protein [Thermoanaerobaculia bacterium]